MKITSKHLTNIAGVIILIWLAFMVLSIPYNIGKIKGREEYKEMSERVDCEIGYGNKPQSEITGKCLKYFKLQEGQ